VQRVIETVMLAAAIWARQQTRSRNLVLSGGLALNCVANSMLAREAGFDNATRVTQDRASELWLL
jgi:carbamoyltransferase